MQAFAASEAGTFDAIFMDIMMPEMNGYEATRAIRALNRPDAESIPVIAMTANAFAEDVHAAMEAGMNAHVAKPVDLDVLRAALEKTLLCKGRVEMKRNTMNLGLRIRRVDEFFAGERQQTSFG